MPHVFLLLFATRVLTDATSVVQCVVKESLKVVHCGSLVISFCSQVRKSTLNPNANEFKPRFNTQVVCWTYTFMCQTEDLNFFILIFYFCSFSPSQPTPRPLLGLRVSPAPPLLYSSPLQSMVSQSASPKCTRSLQSAQECR